MQIRITHRTQYDYAPAAAGIALRLRLFPSQFEGQRVINWQVNVNGAEVAPLFTDGFGDQIGLWHCREKSELVEITAAGVVETGDRTGVVKGLPRRPPKGVFLRSTSLTGGDSGIADLAEAVSGTSPLDRMHALSHAVADALEYKKDVTTSATTAVEALQMGAGVCQDFAHVFVSAARHLGAPARYVSGYLLTGEDDEELRETHAWAEAFVEDLGWVGFDPSNGVCPTERYVRLSCGLDASAAAPIRGCVPGDSEVELDARVDIGQVQHQAQE